MRKGQAIRAAQQFIIIVAAIAVAAIFIISKF